MSEPMTGVVRLEQVAASLRELFRRYGFTPVAPPVLASAAPFLDTSGEDMRRHMYVFTDPGGAEVCLRPELTIPTVGIYGARPEGAPAELRAYYVGPAFRYAGPSDGGGRQITHAGVELLGAADTALADAEVLAIARASLVEHGVTPGRLVVSDIGFLQAAVVGSAVPAQAGLARAAGDPVELAAALDRAAPGPSGLFRAGGTGPAEPDDGSELDRLVAQLPPSLRAELLDRIIGGLDPEALGVRTAEEIAERLVTRSAARPVEPVPAAVESALRTLLALDAPLPAGLDAVAEQAAALGSTALADLVDGWRRRVEMIAAYGIDPATVTLRLGLRRGIDYYTSFIFEVEDPAEGADPMCAGGRYDDLVGRLTGGPAAPGVGFALDVDHLVRLAPDVASGPTVVALVVPAEDAAATAACVSVASVLRAAGVACRLGGSADGADVPVLVSVGPAGVDGPVVVRGPKGERSVPGTDVADAVREVLDGD